VHRALDEYVIEITVQSTKLYRLSKDRPVVHHDNVRKRRNRTASCSSPSLLVAAHIDTLLCATATEEAAPRGRRNSSRRPTQAWAEAALSAMMIR